MLGKVIETNIILPIVGICLAYVVLNCQVRYLLMDQHHLDIVARIVRVSLAT